ncbi:hypothetical protein BH10PSE17_BH10PSE17_12970 [soil metagenome]
MKRTVLAGLAVAVGLLASGCATAPMADPAPLFHDDLFAPPATPVDPSAALALSPAMRDYARHNLRVKAANVDQRKQLVEALYRDGELRIDYDASITRNAAQAFDSRSGNCLALVLMTAAFAKELGLSVVYQQVLRPPIWDRSDEVLMSIGHVNLTLNNKLIDAPGASTQELLTVDFMRPPEGSVQRVRRIGEATLVAMYLNNRAVESIVARRPADAYWFVRAAIERDPALLEAYMTLAVVYRQQGHPALAEPALARVLTREPDDVNALRNQLNLARDLGRVDESAALEARLARLDPHPAFSYFQQGRIAFDHNRREGARRLFETDIARAPRHHEFEFWLAMTYERLGQPHAAREHLARAVEISATRRERDLYAAKLDRWNAPVAH